VTQGSEARLARRLPGFAVRLAALLAAAGFGMAPASAQDVAAQIGDWIYGSDGEMVAASTRNADGTMFGLVCSPECIGYINDDRSCDEAVAYDAVMTSPDRADPMQLECRHHDEGYALLFTLDAAFVDTLRNGPEVTITVRRRGHADRVYRFSLNGAYDAVYITLATAIAMGGRRPDTENHGL